MSDHLTLMQLLAEPAQRRCWLLSKALECGPLEQAIEWARRADEFISGPLVEPPAGAGVGPQTARVPSPPRQLPQLINLPASVVAKRDETAAAAPPQRPTISVEQRGRLIERIAGGATNADLAAEFGLTPKQVQGVRIGCSREIAARRGGAVPQPAQAVAPSPASVVSVDEVIRYLRQQDDVVVPQGSGEFLVNARFRLDLGELVNRANRIRARQGKPEFALANGTNGHAAVLASANGHAIA